MVLISGPIGFGYRPGFLIGFGYRPVSERSLRRWAPTCASGKPCQVQKLRQWKNSSSAKINVSVRQCETLKNLGSDSPAPLLYSAKPLRVKCEFLVLAQRNTQSDPKSQQTSPIRANQHKTQKPRQLGGGRGDCGDLGSDCGSLGSELV